MLCSSQCGYPTFEGSLMNKSVLVFGVDLTSEGSDVPRNQKKQIKLIMYDHKVDSQMSTD